MLEKLINQDDLMERFLERLYIKDERFTLRFISDSNAEAITYNLRMKEPSLTKKEIEDLVREHNREYHSYFIANPMVDKEVHRFSAFYVDIDKKKDKRKEKYNDLPYHRYTEDDESLRQSTSILLSKLKKYNLMPTTITETGNGYQLFWILNQDEILEELWKRIELSLIKFCNGDGSVQSKKNLLRLPLSKNIKLLWNIESNCPYEREAKEVSFVFFSDKTYKANDFTEILSKDSKEKVTPSYFDEEKTKDMAMKIAIPVLKAKGHNLYDNYQIDKEPCFLYSALAMKELGLDYDEAQEILKLSEGFNPFKDRKTYEELDPKTITHTLLLRDAKEADLKMYNSLKKKYYNNSKNKSKYELFSTHYLIKSNNSNLILRSKIDEDFELNLMPHNAFNSFCNRFELNPNDKESEALHRKVCQNQYKQVNDLIQVMSEKELKIFYGGLFVKNKFQTLHDDPNVIVYNPIDRKMISSESKIEYLSKLSCFSEKRIKSFLMANMLVLVNRSPYTNFNYSSSIFLFSDKGDTGKSSIIKGISGIHLEFKNLTWDETDSMISSSSKCGMILVNEPDFDKFAFHTLKSLTGDSEVFTQVSKKGGNSIVCPKANVYICTNRYHKTLDTDSGLRRRIVKLTEMDGDKWRGFQEENIINGKDQPTPSKVYKQFYSEIQNETIQLVEDFLKSLGNRQNINYVNLEEYLGLNEETINDKANRDVSLEIGELITYINDELKKKCEKVIRIQNDPKIKSIFTTTDDQGNEFYLGDSKVRDTLIRYSEEISDYCGISFDLPKSQQKNIPFRVV